MAKARRKVRKPSKKERKKALSIAKKHKNKFKGKNTYAPWKKGKSKYVMDQWLQALPPGKRISQNGRVYYEYRENRSDATKEKV